MPKHLDEQVARYHLEKLGVKLTTLTKAQSDYLDVPEGGPYKAENHAPMNGVMSTMVSEFLITLSFSSFAPFFW